MLYIKHTLVAIKGLKQVVIELTAQDSALRMVTSTFKKASMNGLLLRITHMATKTSVFEKCV